ncbi:MAG: type II toxin-antitoxin system HicA family toxin [Bacteroidales bacterium]|nr:type II toxin-antitoxin system HicA family toxin [Bacteroidales bacterium]
MSKFEKLKRKFIGNPKTFTHDELRSLLKGLGYDEKSHGKTTGSSVAFFNTVSKHIIRLHKPHPGNELKRYQIEQILSELTNQGVLK